MCFFFFKQKTAYEMRISDWSSDVCSSDLLAHVEQGERLAVRGEPVAEPGAEGRADPGIVALLRPTCRLAVPREEIALARVDHVRLFIARQKAGPFIRSEEHTSELQSLMRISYAVFCLKKTNNVPHAVQTKKH